MPQLSFRSHLSKDAETLFAFYLRPDALQLLTPPWAGRVVATTPVALGAVGVLEVPIGPIRLMWVSTIVSFEPPKQFTDHSVRGPFNAWDHRHGIDPDPADSRTAWIDDTIEYELPMGRLGALVGGALVRHRLEQTFRWRHQEHARQVGAKVLAGLAKG